MNPNAIVLEKELDWFVRVLETRFNLYFNKKSEVKDVFHILPPDLSDNDSIYSRIINHYNFNFLERFTIILALVPHIRPQLLDIFFLKNSKYDRHFTEFGGKHGKSHNGFLPTGETLAFLLGGNNLTVRFVIQEIFDASHVFAKHHIIDLQHETQDEPLLSGTIVISKDFIDLFTVGKTAKPNFNSQFPAQQITTKLDWSDLILEDSVHDGVQEIMSWVKHKNTILNVWHLDAKIKPGYRALFYGPPGTGKTLTACLLGKSTGKDVYRVDLSMIVSKWVGETEKNLGRVFDMAENKDWILFFDEADALFGKRTDTKSSQERYANQEVAYLLQRTEDYPGTVILASNKKGNMDEAFIRRFQSIVYFPMPKPIERLKIWQKAFDCSLYLDEDIDLNKIAVDYEIAGGGIVNIVKYCAIKAAERNDKTVIENDLKDGIRKELLKEGKLL